MWKEFTSHDGNNDLLSPKILSPGDRVILNGLGMVKEFEPHKTEIVILDENRAQVTENGVKSFLDKKDCWEQDETGRCLHGVVWIEGCSPR